MEPPKQRSWTIGDGFLGAMAIVAACIASYGAAELTVTPWIIFFAFAATLAILLAGIVIRQARRHERQNDEYAAWLERRVGGPPKEKKRGS